MSPLPTDVGIGAPIGGYIICTGSPSASWSCALHPSFSGQSLSLLLSFPFIRLDHDHAGGGSLKPVLSVAAL